MSDILEIKNSLQDELKKVDSILLEQKTIDAPLINMISNHLTSSGGKRIRAMMTIISAQLFDYQGDSHIKLASAIELIHSATLLHDDVIDESAIRRGKATANNIWGSKASILVGDFLFSLAFRLMVSSRSMKALDSLALASSNISEGEVMQLSMLSNCSITEEQYHKIINAKTGELFASACQVGAIISEQDSQICHSMHRFGMMLGSIFQIKDDYLDYFSEKESLGKNIGDDFFEGKITLPVIFTLQRSSSQEKSYIEEIFAKAKRSDNDLVEVMQLIKKHNISTEISKALDQITKEANAILSSVPGNQTQKKQLQEILNFAAKREF